MKKNRNENCKGEGKKEEKLEGTEYREFLFFFFFDSVILQIGLKTDGRQSYLIKYKSFHQALPMSFKL